MTDAERVRALENGLEWIRFHASVHCIGGAFDPEHMRDLANLAIAVLNGEPLPDYEESVKAAKTSAKETAARWAEMTEEDE